MIINSPNKDTFEISAIDYFFVFCCVIFLGSGTVFTQGSLENFGLSVDAGIEGIIGKLFMLLFSVLLLVKHHISLKCCFNYRITMILLIWGVLQFVKYRQFSTYSFVRLMNVYFALVLINCYGKTFIVLIEDVIAKLSAIDVVLWVILVIAPEVMIFILSLSPIKGYGLVEGNSLFVFASGFQYELFIRNIGFAWEPGRYGCIVAFALYLNLVINKFQIRDNVRFWILTLALLSSQSTTAYVAYIFILCFYFFNANRKYVILLTPIFIIGVIILMSFDFMSEKLLELSISNEDHLIEWEKQLDYYSTQDTYLVPQRFDALYLECLNILHDPLLGNATDTFSYLYDMFNVNFSLSNGVLRIISNMGIFIAGLYYWMLYKSSKWMSFCNHYHGSWFFLMFFVLINVSYSWIFEPLFLAFIFIPTIKEVEVNISYEPEPSLQTID